MSRFPTVLLSAVLLLLALLAVAPPAHALAVEEAEQMGRDAVAAHAAGDLTGAEATLRAALARLGEDGNTPGSWQERSDTWARRTRLYLLRELADLRLTQGRMAEAAGFLRTAAPLATGDTREEAHLLNQQGLLLWRMGDLGKAGLAFALATAHYERLGGDFAADQAMTRGNLGLVSLDRHTAGGPDSLLDEAEAQFREARDRFQAVDQKEGLANQWGNLGLVYRLQGRLDEAERAQSEALALNRSLGNRIGEIDALGSLGRVFEDRRNFDRAAALYAQALDLSRTMGYARGIAHHGLYLADLALTRGNVAAVDGHAVPALEAARAIGNPHLIASLLNRRIRAAVGRGACKDAEALLAELDGSGGQDADRLRAEVKGCRR